ncbi:MarR family winged helix-turn-helix transcriptional regulator [Streptomyces flaveus]|uniref:MarR family winged helix-turn-helix transcriptional regulator n=1 Tax=Streptomyces flaveus TaxID=66370 RepID=UPI00332D79CA
MPATTGTDSTARDGQARPKASFAATLAEMNGRCNCTASRRATRYLTAAYDKALAPVGLRTTQFNILHRLALEGGTTIMALAQRIAMDRTTLATNLKPLERDGLIVVQPSDTDRRARKVEITETGLERLEQAVPLWKGAQDQFESTFGETEAAELRAALRAVLETGFDPWAE